MRRNGNARNFVIGGAEITSEEGISQGGPTAMSMCAAAIIPLIMMLLELTKIFRTNKRKWLRLPIIYQLVDH